MSETTPAAEQPVDPWLVERLLANPATAGDDDEQALAILFAALRSPAAASELAERDHYLAAFAAAQTLRTVPHQSRRKPMLASFLAAKTVVAGFAMATVAGAAAAAYSGSLPAALQDVAHQSVGAPAADATQGPKPDPTRTKANKSTAPVSTPTKGTSRGPDATGSAAHGLCTAFSKGGLGAKSTAREALSEAAGGPSQIPAFCAAVLQNSADATARANPRGKSGDQSTGKPTDKPTDKTSRPTDKPTEHPVKQP